MANETDHLAHTRGTASTAAKVPGKVIDRAIKLGELKAVKCGRRYIILSTDLRAWLELCKQRGHFPSSVTDNDRERLASLNRARKATAA